MVQKISLKSTKNYDYCYVQMPSEDNETLKYSYGEKSDETCISY